MDTAAVVVTLEHFTPIVGRVFGGGDAPGQSSYTLVAASPLPTQNYPGRQREAFALVFRADTPEPVQGIRIFDLPEIGPTEIFLVPIDVADGLCTYEAIFT